jgi:2-keto-4-pentenoate hydratase
LTSKLDNRSAIARRILQAYETRQPIGPVRGEITGVSEAYAVQQAALQIWHERGRIVAGHKIGLTSKPVQTQLGVDEPDFGTLFSDMILESGALVELERVLQPRVEAEIAFVLKSDLYGDRISPDAVVAATDYVCPAIEICGSRIAGWDIKIEDTIADNASSGLVVLGSTRHKPVLADLAAVAMKITQNRAVAGEGQGAACLGNPAIAVAWLAEALTRFGGGLKAGELVMSGALSKMLSAAPGDEFRADFGAMGSVSVDFAK